MNMLGMLVEPVKGMPEWNFWVDLGLIVLFTIVLDIAIFYWITRRFPRIFIAVLQLLFITAYIFDLKGFMIACAASLIIGITVSFFANLNDIRSYIGNNVKAGNSFLMFKRNKKKKKGEALFNRDEVYKKIFAAVSVMSKNKIGAIITLEKDDPMDDIAKTGTIIKAPVSAELLQTIFYPGTRLHDGAVIIRNDQIIAASVYYTPTTVPLTGKYGSRHRAAIGISEICDAVTIVVSEETGRVSIAYKGELQSVAADKFLSTLESMMVRVDVEDK